MSGAASKKFRAEGTTFQIGKIEMVARYVEESGVMNVFFVFRDQGDPGANRDDPAGDHTRQRDRTLARYGIPREGRPHFH